MTTSVTDAANDLVRIIKNQTGGYTTGPGYQAFASACKLEAALSTQPKAVSVTACCGRHECGGECGNEWQGMRSVRRSGEETIMAIMGADNMDHAIRILDEYASLTAIIDEGD